MLTAKHIRKLFEEMNEALEKEGETGEIGIVGGAVMCIVYQARASTRDVDAVFAPTRAIRKIASEIGEKHGLGKDWLNDAVKGFLVEGFKREEVLSLSHLRVWAPEPRYMLAMKCLSARWDSHDRDDVIFLIKRLKLKKPSEVFKIIEGYYPKEKIPAKTQFLIEEVLERI